MTRGPSGQGGQDNGVVGPIMPGIVPLSLPPLGSSLALAATRHLTAGGMKSDRRDDML